MTPQWASVNSWKVGYKSKGIGYIKLHDGSLYVDPSVDYNDTRLEEYIANEKLTEIIWDNIEPCINCLPDGKCTPGHNMKILGKDFTHVCGYHTRFKNPDATALDCVKKIMEYRKNVISGNA